MALSRRLRALKAPNVGLLLPASAGCDLALLALQLAGKLPVLLNWTTGPANLAHAARAFFLNGGKRLYVSRVFAPSGPLNAPDWGVAKRTIAVGGGTATWTARCVPSGRDSAIVAASASRPTRASARIASA